MTSLKANWCQEQTWSSVNKTRLVVWMFWATLTYKKHSQTFWICCSTFSWHKATIAFLCSCVCVYPTKISSFYQTCSWSFESFGGYFWPQSRRASNLQNLKFQSQIFLATCVSVAGQTCGEGTDVVGEWRCDSTEAWRIKSPAEKLQQSVSLQLHVKPLVSYKWSERDINHLISLLCMCLSVSLCVYLPLSSFVTLRSMRKLRKAIKTPRAAKPYHSIPHTAPRQQLSFSSHSVDTKMWVSPRHRHMWGHFNTGTFS